MIKIDILMIAVESIKGLKKQIFTSQLLKHAGTYTISNILEKGIPFLLLPILTRFLSQVDVGYYTLYQAILALLIPVYTLSIDSSITLNFFKIDQKRFKEYFSSGIYLFLTIFFFLGILSVLFSNTIRELVEFPFFWLSLVIIIVALQFFTTLRKSLWQINDKPLKYAFFSIGLSLLKNITGLFLIFYTGLGWKGIIVGHLIGQFLFAIYSIITFYKSNLLVLKLSFLDVKDLIKVGTPLSLHRFGTWLGDSLNRLVITSLIGVAATGNYGIGATFGIFVTICQDAFNRAYVPYLFKKLKNYSEEIRKELLKTTISYYIGLFTFAFIVGITGFYMVGFIFGDAYNETREFIIPLVFAAAFNGIYKIHVNYIFFTKKTHIIMMITLFMGFLNILLVYLMVDNFGILGAAYSTLFIQILTYLCILYLSSKEYPIFKPL